VSETQQLSKDEQGKLWGKLTNAWKVIKSNASDELKTQAKTIINDAQKQLNLDITDFTKPYQPKTETTTTEVSATTTKSTTQNPTEKILQQFMDEAFPIALATAKKYLPNAQLEQQMITAEAFLKPMGMVYASLIRNQGKI